MQTCRRGISKRVEPRLLLVTYGIIESFKRGAVWRQRAPPNSPPSTARGAAVMTRTIPHNVRLRGAWSNRKACPNTRATNKIATDIRLPEARPACTNAVDRSKVPHAPLR